jgi:hypothetical protein
MMECWRAGVLDRKSEKRILSYSIKTITPVLQDSDILMGVKILITLLSPQIGFDDLGIALDLIRRTFRNFNPEIQDTDMIRKVHDRGQVMLDPHNGYPHIPVNIQDVACDVFFLLNGHSRHDLVQQKQLGTHGEGPGHIDPFADSERQDSDRGVAKAGKAHKIDDLLFDLPAMSHFIANDIGQSQKASQKRELHETVAAEFDVVQDGHALKEFYLLKGPGDSQGGNGVRLNTVYFFAIEYDAAVPGPVVHIDAVEQAGLPGTVGPDNGEDIALLHGQTNSIEHVNTPERKVQIFYF